LSSFRSSNSAVSFVKFQNRLFTPLYATSRDFQPARCTCCVYLGSSTDTMAALAATPHTLAVVALTTWRRRLGHAGPDTLSGLSRSSFIQCTSNKHEFCHACQLDKHTRLPFHSSSHRTEHPFDLIHLDLWTSPIVSVSSSKYYLVILDDFSHYL
jgi:hypothetical protein